MLFEWASEKNIGIYGTVPNNNAKHSPKLIIQNRYSNPFCSCILTFEQKRKIQIEGKQSFFGYIFI